MDSVKPFVFVSYAREDYPIVSQFVSALRSHGVETWMDIDALRPGEIWKDTIEQALRRANALLVFVSRNSMRSNWVRLEFELVVKGQEMPVIPVILEEVPDLPMALRERQWVVLTNADAGRIDQAAANLARHLEAQPIASSNLSKPRLDAVTGLVAEKARGLSPSAPSVSPGTPTQSVFVVHGHDVAFLNDVVQYLQKLHLQPIVLTRIGGAQQSLFQKFMNVAGTARFAIVLLSSDDFGASRAQYEAPKVGERSLKYRARQNVIFELGFFFGRLGWENVFVVYKPPPDVFPDFEHPSDLLGTVFDEVDASGAWYQSLTDRLASAGFRVTASATTGP